MWRGAIGGMAGVQKPNSGDKNLERADRPVAEIVAAAVGNRPSRRIPSMFMMQIHTVRLCGGELDKLTLSFFP